MLGKFVISFMLTDIQPENRLKTGLVVVNKHAWLIFYRLKTNRIEQYQANTDTADYCSSHW